MSVLPVLPVNTDQYQTERDDVIKTVLSKWDPKFYPYLVTFSWFDNECRDNLKQLIDWNEDCLDHFLSGAWDTAKSGQFPEYVQQNL